MLYLRDSVVLEVEPERSLVIPHIFRTDLSMYSTIKGRLYAGYDLLAMSAKAGLTKALPKEHHAQTIHSHWSTKAKTECPSKTEHHILT